MSTPSRTTIERPRAEGRRDWAAHLQAAWLERVWYPLGGRARCTVLPGLLQHPALAGRPVLADLAQIVNTIVGRRLTGFVMGDHPTRQSLTDFFERGAAQARQLVAYTRPADTLLEYGGGVGRLGRAVAPHVTRLVSVDVNPLMKTYGQVLSPGVEFLNREELGEAETFDGAYSIAVFFHLPLAQQRIALEYVHRRLKPGGWFLVDLKIGAETSEPDSNYGNVSTTALGDFQNLYEPWFTAKRVPLFNAGFLLWKAGAASAAASLAGRYMVNDASIAYDVLEGEVVVVNLDSGAYYILQGTASAVWQMLASGRSVPEMVEALSRHHGCDAGPVETAVTDFVGQLTAEALLVAATGLEPSGPAFNEQAWPGAGTPFTAPVMFRYTDMQALIQMDPIREYDETGWPRRPAARAE